MTETQRATKHGVAGRLTKKLLAPIVATAANALASYAAKNAPRILEETILPKLREARQSADGVVHDLPAQARGAAQSAADLSHDLAARVSGGEGEPSTRSGPFTNTQLEKRREARADRRARRRKASTT
jgi:hypothetical protein